MRRLLLASLLLFTTGCGIHSFSASPIDADPKEDAIDCFHIARDRPFASDRSFGVYCKESE